MRIEIDVQTDKCGDEFLDGRKELVDIFAVRDRAIIETHDKQYIIPLAVLRAIDELRR